MDLHTTPSGRFGWEEEGDNEGGGREEDSVEVGGLLGSGGGGVRVRRGGREGKGKEEDYSLGPRRDRPGHGYSRYFSF